MWARGAGKLWCEQMLAISKENHPLHQENRRFFRCYWKYFEFWEIKMRKTQVSDMARNGQEWFSEKFDWRVIFWHGNKETIFVGNFCHVWEIDFTPKAQDRIALMIKIDLTNCSFICKTSIWLQSTIAHSSAMASLSSLLSSQRDSTDDPWQDIVNAQCCSQWGVGLDCWGSLKRKEKTLVLKKHASGKA